ncbi:transporter substrate-binding domain-containing protein [Shewanella sp. UCD-KL12]|uniref:transporter substrate-binding domain-containing protein n=1 Tax=Shewanella sp. UCD-KL12 TaxID=1917163 RepID=UPI000970EFC6|nr:transporter substrate-binding domain-containing protein [Shewanella sp. UCD-KL12]
MGKTGRYHHRYSAKASKALSPKLSLKLVPSPLLYLIVLTLYMAMMQKAIAEPYTSQARLSPTPTPTLRICYEDRNNFPFVTKGDQNFTNTLGNRGTLADIIINAAQAIELPITFSRLPWKRCIQQLSQGKSDAIFAAIWTQDRDSQWVFPKVDGVIEPKLRLWRARYPIFTAKHSTLQWHNGRFTNLKLGVSAPLGYVAHDKLNKLDVLPANNLSVEEGFNLIARERLDGYVVERFIGQHTIQKLRLSQEISTLDEDFMQMDWFVPVSHAWYQEHPQLTQQLWQSISEVREQQGDAIFKRYTEPKLDATP